MWRILERDFRGCLQSPVLLTQPTSTQETPAGASTFLPSRRNPEPIAYSSPGNTTHCLNHSLLFQADTPLPGGPAFSTRKPFPGSSAHIRCTFSGVPWLTSPASCTWLGHPLVWLLGSLSLPKQCLSSLQRASESLSAYPHCPLQVWAEQSLHGN